MANKYGLTKNQLIFCDEYLIDRNATRAYMVAYPSVKNYQTAAAAASRLLKNVKVIAYLNEKMKVQAERAEISAENTLRGINNIASANICDLIKSVPDASKKGKKIIVKDIESLPLELQMAVKSIKVKANGEIELTMYDKVKALELLGRHQALFTENLEVRGYVKAEADINVNPYKELTTEELKKLAAGEDDK